MPRPFLLGAVGVVLVLAAVVVALMGLDRVGNRRRGDAAWRAALAAYDPRYAIFVGTNVISVRTFGEVEFWLASIKVVAIVVFLGAGLTLLAAVVLGGLGSLTGALLGAALLTFLPDVVADERARALNPEPLPTTAPSEGS